MTLQEVQNTIIELAYWIGDWGSPEFDVNEAIQPDMQLRRDLNLNDEELMAMFGTTDVVTVGDCMEIPDGEPLGAGAEMIPNGEPLGAGAEG